jgi:hypothetical protein
MIRTRNDLLYWTKSQLSPCAWSTRKFDGNFDSAELANTSTTRLQQPTAQTQGSEKIDRQYQIKSAKHNFKLSFAVKAGGRSQGLADCWPAMSLLNAASRNRIPMPTM